MIGLGGINSFTYEEQTYYFNTSRSIPKEIDEKYIIDNIMTLTEIEEFFNAKITYNYENKAVYINI